MGLKMYDFCVIVYLFKKEMYEIVYIYVLIEI